MPGRTGCSLHTWTLQRVWHLETAGRLGGILPHIDRALNPSKPQTPPHGKMRVVVTAAVCGVGVRKMRKHKDGAWPRAWHMVR